jgi:hypothetical protein
LIRKEEKKLAFHLRQLSVGLTTNDDFEDSVMDDITDGWLPEQYYRSSKSQYDDSVIVPMLETCWGLYDDTRQHKLVGRNKLPDESLKTIARCILFLRSDFECEWPHFYMLNPIIKFSIPKCCWCWSLIFLQLDGTSVTTERKKWLLLRSLRSLAILSIGPSFEK